MGEYLDEQQRIFTDTQINEIGIKHNENLSHSFENFDWSKKDRYAELKSRFKKLKVAKDKLMLFDRLPVSSSQNLKKIKERLSEHNNYVYFEEIVKYVEELNGTKTLYEIKAYIENIQAEAKEKIHNSKDLEAFLIFSTVLKYSAEFWLPKKIGGLGKYNEYNAFKYPDISNQKTNSWQKCLSDVMIADGVSAGAGFIVGAAAAAAATGPVAPATFVAVIAAESGISSGFEYIRSDNCDGE